VAAGAKIAQYRLCEAVTKHNNDVVDKTMSIGMRTIEKQNILSKNIVDVQQ
jgi:hypothetical protein